MTAVLYLSNNWEWSGGFLQYLNWNGLIADSILPRKLSWDEYRDDVSKFYTCDHCQKDYLKQLQYILGRVNVYTKTKYADDPAIMAWELANEPRPMRAPAVPAYRKWISHVASFIKSIDKNHLVTTGAEGDMGTESLQVFEDIHSDSNIDYLTIHIWPKNWAWFNDTAIAKSWTAITRNTAAYVQKHVAIANKLHKPLVVEEFGLPRDHHSFDTASATTLRDAYYQFMFSLCRKNSTLNGGPITGCNFWAFGGTGRPFGGQVFWKKGDGYLGDPPTEEQGLNSVFDSDLSTWKIIKSFTKEIANTK